MDLCQESETVVGNDEHEKIQGAEETAQTLNCPDERNERNHVYCLLGVSNLTLEEDERVDEFAIGTGWEEAVSVFSGRPHSGLYYRSFSKVVYLTKKCWREHRSLGAEVKSWQRCALLGTHGQLSTDT